MKKKCLVTISMIIGILLIIGVTAYIIKIHKLKKEFNKMDIEDSYNYIHLLCNDILSEDLLKKNGIDRKNEKLYNLKSKYQEIINCTNSDISLTLLPEIIIINDYYSIDNTKYYELLDDYYNEEYNLISDYSKEFWNEEDGIIDGVDMSCKLLYWYIYTDFGEQLIKRYNIVKGMENVYNNSEVLLKDDPDNMQARIADVFVECDVKSNIDMSIVKSDFEEDVKKFEAYISSDNFKLDLSTYGYRSYVNKYEKIGFDTKELKNINKIIKKWSLDELKESNYGLTITTKSDSKKNVDENIQLSDIEEIIIGIRREMYLKDNIFKNEDFVNSFCKYLDGYTEDVLIPQFEEYYNSVKDRLYK